MTCSPTHTRQPAAGGIPLAPLARWPVPRQCARAALTVGLLSVAVIIAGCSGGTTNSSNKPGQPPATVVVPPAATDLQQTVVNVIQTVQPSVVEIQSSGGQGGAIGSGEVYDGSGHIVTNDHVVAGFQSFQVILSNGHKLAAQLVGEAPEDDLAVLKVNQNGLQPINLGDSNKVLVGEFALAIGSPLGLQQSATFGIISALDRTASEAPSGPAGTLTGLIQTSAPINPGNSGGALVNLQGQLIGIPTLAAANPESGTAASGIGFAIPVNRVKFVADQLIKSGHVTNTGQGFLGVVGVSVTAGIAQANNLPVDHGVLVTDFAPDASGQSPAQKAGVQQGDIIIAVNGKEVDTSQDLSGALLSLAPGTQIKLTVARGSGQQQVTVALGERPPSNG